MSEVSNLNKPSKAIVVLLDLLGTKEIYKDTSTINAINEKYNNLLTKIEGENEDLFWINIGEQRYDLNPELRTFSDTILIIINIDKINIENHDIIEKQSICSFLYMYCNTMKHIFYEFLSKGFFLRGVISYGDIWVGDPLIIGPAIDEAEEWLNQGDWMGIFLTPCAKYEYDVFLNKHRIGLSKNPTKEESDTFKKTYNSVINYKVPIKNDIVFETYAINWPSLCKLKQKENFSIEEIFSRRPIYPSIYAKYKNTMDFYYYVIKNTNDQANTITNQGMDNK